MCPDGWVAVPSTCDRMRRRPEFWAPYWVPSVAEVDSGGASRRRHAVHAGTPGHRQGRDPGTSFSAWLVTLPK